MVDPEAVRPVRLGLRLLTILATLHPEDFRWTPYPTAVNPDGHGHLLRLTGSQRLVDLLVGDPGALSEEGLAQITRAPGWWKRAAPHLLYP
jgi:hypothetical protein